MSNPAERVTPWPTHRQKARGRRPRHRSAVRRAALQRALLRGKRRRVDDGDAR